MAKVNIENFNQNSMLSKLLVISRDYQHKQDELLSDRNLFDSFVKDAVTENFIYKSNVERHILAHLSLFLLGNPDNKFSKISAL